MKAFPHSKYYSDHNTNDFMNGMDLRDFFAAWAMQAMIIKAPNLIEDAPCDISSEAYEYADAMMKARAAE